MCQSTVKTSVIVFRCELLEIRGGAPTHLYWLGALLNRIYRKLCRPVHLEAVMQSSTHVAGKVCGEAVNALELGEAAIVTIKRIEAAMPDGQLVMLSNFSLAADGQDAISTSQQFSPTNAFSRN